LPQIFLHSALVQSRNIDTRSTSKVRDSLRYYTIESTAALLLSFTINLFLTTVFAKAFYGRPKAHLIGMANAAQYLKERFGSLGFIPMHYVWAIGKVGMAVCLLFLAFFIGCFLRRGWKERRERI
jgi:Mn2+/Fe2+ NRAMP family transporter